MAQQSILVSGSCGLIGSEVSVFFAQQGFRVTGIDSNHRETFFGPEGKHSIFGASASKVAADVMVQEYGRYFGMPTCCLRGDA